MTDERQHRDEPADDAPADDALSTRGLSYVIPAYNEERSIARMAEAAREAAADLIELGEIDAYEIVIVDDASTDSTAAVCAELADADPNVVVLRNETNLKLGGTLRAGFARARGHWVLYTDADLPFDLWELRTAFRLLRTYDADIVSAYRLSRTGEGLRRLIYSHIYNTMIKVRFGLKVRDVNFAGKLMRRAVLDAVTLTSEGSFIDAELLIRAERAGFRVVQFGVDYFPRTRGVSTLSSWNVIRTLLDEMRQIGPDLDRGRNAS